MEARAAYSVDLIQEPESGVYDAVVLAVAHDQFRSLGEDGLRGYGRDPHILYDVKYLLRAEETDGRL
jgi:UDP-N-acetyl-D-galactosamine dehydrogenase